jgi:hypothetical protein
MPGSPFFGDNDSMADSGTALDILRRKFPGMISDNPTIGNDEANKALFFASGAPTLPTGAQAMPNAMPAPDVGEPSATPGFDAFRAMLTGNQSQPQQPSAAQRFVGGMQEGAQASQGIPQARPQTKAELLGRVLTQGLSGAMRGRAANEQMVAQSGGRRSGGMGVGFEAAEQAPLEMQQQRQQLQGQGLQNQLLQNQVTYAPQMMQLNFGKTMSDIQKNLGDAASANATAALAPTKAALDSAQALAARYKEDPGSGQLMDLQSGQPFGNSSGLAPLTAAEATVLGKAEGDRVPIKLKNTASEIVNRGIHSVSAGGRQLLVDSQGNTIKDVGQATPLTLIQQQQAPQQVTPDMQKAVDMVGNAKMDLPTALMNFRRFPGQAITFLGALNDQYPNWSQATYGVSKQTMEYFTTGQGGNELNAFRTAISHADLLGQAAQALQNNDTKALNTVKNALKTQFGDPEPTNFNVIANAYTREVTKALAAGHITDSEVNTQGATMPQNAGPKQILGAVNAYKNLMASKAQQRMQQYEQGLQGKPAFPPGMTPGGNGGGHVIALGGKQYQYNGSGDTADIKNYTEVRGR